MQLKCIRREFFSNHIFKIIMHHLIKGDLLLFYHGTRVRSVTIRVLDVTILNTTIYTIFRLIRYVIG